MTGHPWLAIIGVGLLAIFVATVPAMLLMAIGVPPLFAGLAVLLPLLLLQRGLIAFRKRRAAPTFSVPPDLPTSRKRP